MARRSSSGRPARTRTRASKDGAGAGRKRVRFAVVGLGHIAQVAVLPAFAHSPRCTLAALVSGDPRKIAALGRKYRVGLLRSYEDYDALVRSGDIDAVYIALPNDLHRDYAVRAARAGVHVLCEKPLGLDEHECLAMIQAAEEGGVRLMTAYRLHFERANMKAVETIASGRIGEPRILQALFGLQVRDAKNVRLDAERGGGPLYDLGVYCINAARYLFRSEPEEVLGMHARSGQQRFAEVPEMTSALLRFPGERLASFTCSFGSADVSSCRVVGTEGDLELEPAFDYSTALELHQAVGGRRTTRVYPKRDQFAPELSYFADCVLEGREPEPSGREGLADVRVIRAILESARTGRSIRLTEFRVPRRPSLEQEAFAPPVRKREEIRASAPRGD